MNKNYTLSYILGLAFIAVTLFLFINQWLLVGNTVTVIREKPLYIGQFRFSYNDLGWVSVSYRYEENKSIGDTQYPVSVNDVIGVGGYGLYGMNINDFYFKVIDITDSYVTLERIK